METQEVLQDLVEQVLHLKLQQAQLPEPVVVEAVETPDKLEEALVELVVVEQEELMEDRPVGLMELQTLVVVEVQQHQTVVLQRFLD